MSLREPIRLSLHLNCSLIIESLYPPSLCAEHNPPHPHPLPQWLQLSEWTEGGDGASCPAEKDDSLGPSDATQPGEGGGQTLDGGGVRGLCNLERTAPWSGPRSVSSVS